MFNTVSVNLIDHAELLFTFILFTSVSLHLAWNQCYLSYDKEEMEMIKKKRKRKEKEIQTMGHQQKKTLLWLTNERQ